MLVIAHQKNDRVRVRRLLVNLIYPPLDCINLDFTANVVKENKGFFLLKGLAECASEPINSILL